MTRADYLAIALLIVAVALGLSVASHRLPAEMAYAASLGDQRPPIPQVMPGTLASFGQSRFLPMPGTNTCHAGGNQRPAIPRFKAKRGAGEFREGK